MDDSNTKDVKNEENYSFSSIDVAHPELNSVFVATTDEKNRMKYYGLHCGKLSKEALRSYGELLAKKLFSNKQIDLGHPVAGIKEELTGISENNLAFLLLQEKKLSITISSSMQVLLMFKKEFQIATTTEAFTTFEINPQKIPEFMIFANAELWNKSSKDQILQICRAEHKTIDAAVSSLIHYAKTLDCSEPIAIAIVSLSAWSKRLTPSTFQIPEKRIHGANEFQLWQKSKAHQTLLSFILALQEETKSKANDTECQISKSVESILFSLQTLNDLVDKVPPTDLSSRYGNKSYRVWSSKMEEEAPELMKNILLTSTLDVISDLAKNEDCCKELATQFCSCFGNNTRIDYGSGHEASFLWWLCHFYVLKVIQKSDFLALVTQVFTKYLTLMRKIQKTYKLEPAGSHGVYGIDDFQFLPYVFGASQLIQNSDNLKPNSIHDQKLLEKYGEKYLYFGAIRFIHEMKSGPFAEHSSFLNELSFLPHQKWEKLAFGLSKEYQNQVLNKFVVMQHLLFGFIIPFQ